MQEVVVSCGVLAYRVENSKVVFTVYAHETLLGNEACHSSLQL